MTGTTPTPEPDGGSQAVSGGYTVVRREAVAEDGLYHAKVTYRDSDGPREVGCDTVPEATTVADELRADVGNRDIRIAVWSKSESAWVYL